VYTKYAITDTKMASVMPCIPEKEEEEEDDDSGTSALGVGGGGWACCGCGCGCGGIGVANERGLENTGIKIMYTYTSS